MGRLRKTFNLLPHKPETIGVEATRRIVAVAEGTTNAAGITSPVSTTHIRFRSAGVIIDDDIQSLSDLWRKE